MNRSDLRRPFNLNLRQVMLMAALAALLSGLPAAIAQMTMRQPDAEDLLEAQRLRQQQRKMIEIARDRVFPALVNIHVVNVDYWGGKERKGRGVGSGTIVSKDGYVVTNQHVTAKGKQFKCTLADKQTISAELVGEDPLTDLAVLKLDLGELKDPGMPLPVASFGDSTQLEIGDYVMAMGSPFALSRSVTLGIVSNTERVFGGAWGSGDDEQMQLDGNRTGLFTNWIQHDAAINPGNSGGPLVNLKGEVIGVNELGGSNMGFAIPSNLARSVSDALIEHGEVPRSWIGVSFRNLKDTGLTSGVLVDSVVEGGPAEEAGIEAGDVIIRMNGEPINVQFREQIPPLMKMIARLPIGTSVTLAYERDGQVKEASLVTEKLEKDRGEETALRSWGIAVAEITPRMARARKLDSAAGALVTSTRTGGPADLAEPPLRRGDVIRSIDGVNMEDMNHLIDEYERIMDLDPMPEYLLVQFDHRGKNHITLIKPKPEDPDDPPREVRKAWIGIATQPVLKKLAKKLGDADMRGFRITRVYPRTVAADSELKVGDVIVKLNGDKIRPRGMQDDGLLQRRVRRLDMDDKATLSVMRDGKEHDIEIQLESTRITVGEARRETDHDFELSVREITFFDRDDNRWNLSVKGVIVTSAEPAGWAGLAGIRPGDLLIRVGDRKIEDLRDFRKAMKSIGKQQPERVVFVVMSGIETRFRFAEPEWSPATDDNDAKADKDKQSAKDEE